MRYITIAELRRKLGGRSRNAIFDDVARGLLPRPFKLQKGQGGRNYWHLTEQTEEDHHQDRREVNPHDLGNEENNGK